MMIALQYWQVVLLASIAGGALHYRICGSLRFAIGTALFAFAIAGIPIWSQHVTVVMPGAPHTYTVVAP